MLKAVTTKIGSGATPRGGASVYVDEGAAFIRSQNVLDLCFSDEGLARIGEDAAAGLRNVAVEPGDVLVNITGDSVARVALWTRDESARVSQHVAIVRCDPAQVDARYMQYWLHAPAQKAQLLTLSAAGASRPALTKGMLEDFPFGPHPLAEQHAIAEVLGALDDKIAANRRILNAADDLVRANYARLPASENVVLGDIARSVRQQVGAAEIAANAVYVGLEHFDRKRLWLQRFGAGGDVTSAKNAFETGDTLFGKLRPYFHKVGVAPESGVCSTDVLVIRALDERALWLVSAASSSSEAIARAVQNSNGTRMPRAKWEDISDLAVPDPASREAAVFETWAEALGRRCFAAVAENEALAKTRDELLPLLMSGRITVKDAEKRVEGVV